MLPSSVICLSLSGTNVCLMTFLFTVDPLERLVIIGQSGAGKTTILRLIAGVLKPDRGAIFFGRHEVSQLSDRQLEAIRRRIGMVYQDAALLSSLTVRENLALPLQELTKPRLKSTESVRRPSLSDHKPDSG